MKLYVQLIISLVITFMIKEKLHGEVQPSLETNNYHLYVWGFYNDLEKNPIIAQACFERLIKLNTISTYIYPGYLTHLFNTRKFDVIIDLMPSIEQILHDNLTAQLIFVKSLELQGKSTQAQQRWIQLAQKYKNNPEIVYYAAVASVQQQKFQDALSTIDDYVNASSEKATNFIFYFLKAQIYLNMHQHEKALLYVKKSVELNPGFEQGWLLSGLINELQGSIDEAINGYRHFLSIVGRDTAVEQQLINLVLKKNNTTVVTAQADFDQALALYTQKKYAQALTIAEQCIKQQPDHIPSKLLVVELLCNLKKTQQALDLLQTWIEQEPKQDIWFKALLLLYQAGIEHQNIIKTLQAIERKNPLLANLYCADIYLKKQDRQNAEHYLQKALTLTKDQALLDKLNYQLAALYFDNHDYKKLHVIIENSEQKTTFSPLLNLSAYYYANKGNDLKKAQILLDKALKNDEKNPHYLDTQALIWLKQKNYTKALFLLASLSKELPQDYYVLKHLSQAYFYEGNVNEAMNTIKKALNYCYTDNQTKHCQVLLKRWNATIKS